MKRIGIAVEYNPFHNGHLYQIREIRKRFGEDCLITVAVSGNFVQRGEISFLNKWEKTEAALKYGVDLVVELPLYYSIQNAEVFSRMAARILDYIDIEIQVFGAEEGSLDKFLEVIELQEKQEYKESLMETMKKGNSYATSQKLMLKKYGYGDIVKSNNILGLEYVRTILRENLNMKPYIIRREISEYNELEIEQERKNIASATFLRNQLEKGNAENIKKFVPGHTFKIIGEKKNRIKQEILKDELFKLLKYRLLIEDKENIKKIYDVKNEIYGKIYNGIKNSSNYRQFIDNTKSRNFSIKRIERLMLNIILDISQENMDFNIGYVRVLGFNEKGQRYLKYLKEKKKKIFVNWRDIEKEARDKKIKIEKNGFLIKELLENEKERLNPVIIKSSE